MNTKLSFALSSVLALGSAACLPSGPVPLGEHPLDAMALSEVPELRHLAGALDVDVNELTTLFTDANSLTVSSAPNPTVLLEEMNALDDERAPVGGVELSVLSYNVALLDAKLLFGTIDYAQSPSIEARVEELPSIVFDADYDIVMLQEVWREEDVVRFTEAAEARGYRAAPTTRSEANDGLATFVRESLIAEGTFDVAQRSYDARDGTGIVPGFDDVEWFPGPGIRRGWQMVSFEHPELGELQVFNTHMQAFPESWLGRMLQARELGIELTERATDGAITLVGGDLNAGPYYKDDVWLLPEGEEEPDWWKNAFSYPILLAYGELADMMVMGRSTEDAALDVTLGDLVLNDPDNALEVPFGNQTYCDDDLDAAFTGTDCNTLYFQQYAGTEYPARLDHLHVRDPDGRVFVQQSGITFKTSRTFSDGSESPPSDHYGVYVNLVVSP